MMESRKTSTLEKLFRYYPKMMLTLLVISFLLVLLSIIFIKLIGPAPTGLIVFTTYYLYAHVVWFGLGFILMLYWFLKPVLRQTGIRIGGVIIGIIASPVSAILAYTAVFLFAVSSCSG